MVGEGKKKIAIIGISSLLLVAMVVGLAIGVSRRGHSGGGDKGGGKTETSTKAVRAICQPTEFKETCEKALSKAGLNTTDPKELVKAGIQVAVDSLKESLKNSTTLKELAKDNLTNNALATCEELMEYSIDELKNSIDRVENFDISKLDRYIDDLQVWLSAALTYETTCLDGFQNTTGQAGEKMKEILKKSIELTSNGIDMVNELNIMLGGKVDDLGNDVDVAAASAAAAARNNSNRNLLEDDYIPHWVDEKKRKLLVVPPKSIKPDIVVAQDGSGNVQTINDALKLIPIRPQNRTFVIYVKQGIYKESVVVLKSTTHIMMYGDGPLKTRVTGNKNFALTKLQTQQTSTFAVVGAEFMCKDMGFENTAGPEGHQAVALRVQSDMSVFFNCHMDGYQDTLYVQTHRQFFRDCQITGTIDFIFGNAKVVLQNCKLIVRKPLDDQAECMVTAQGRTKKDEPTGIILQGCTISADPLLRRNKTPVKVYLGRPWKQFARTIVIQSFIDNVIDPAGWSKWVGASFENTCFFGEFGNKGPGANLVVRNKFRGVKIVTSNEVVLFTPQRFFRFDQWITNKGIPYEPAMIKV